MGTSLFEFEEENLIALLKKNIDMFVWAPLDMPDIDTIVVCLHLTIDHSVKIVCQRKHKVGKEKNATIGEELTSIGFIIEVKYPSWMANVVFVTKESNKI